jgi:hypothetical protein
MKVAYRGDVTYDLGVTLTWTVAQESIGIIVACCPHLRPVFELILPSFEPIPSCKLRIRQAKDVPIVVTNRIAVHDSSYSAEITNSYHDGGYNEPWAPTFDVEQGPAAHLQHVPDCGGFLPQCSCRLEHQRPLEHQMA